MFDKTFKTTADLLYEIISKNREISVSELAVALNTTERSIVKIARYLEEAGYVKISYPLKGPVLKYLETEDQIFSLSNKEEIIIILNEFKRDNKFDEAKKLIEKLYEFTRTKNNHMLNSMYKEIYGVFIKNFSSIIESKKEDVDSISLDRINELTHYEVWHENVVVDINIIKNDLEPVPFYNIGLVSLQHTTELILDKIKDSIITTLDYEKVFKSTADHHELIKEQFRSKIKFEIREIFPNLRKEEIDMFVNYVIITSIGLGDIEFLLKDVKLEEIVINNAYEPIWVYHREFGWLKTNIILGDENKIRHFATLGGRIVDKNITNLEPLLDGHLETGDRFNATLFPISTKGNTITIRKFSAKPMTIVDMINKGSITYEAASMIWLAIQFEMSILIVGGTGSGKTTALNIFSVFIPPNQRIISIEDTRELTLANTLHWVAMKTRDPNPEGRGAVTMLDLIVNSLRMRPDRILFGEIRKKEEAETLFEAMHTGHSVIATFHANNSEDAQTRLTEPPINLPGMMLSSLSFIVVLNRNRRTGQRVILQLAEVEKRGTFRVIKEFDFAKGELLEVNKINLFYNYLKLYGGLTPKEVEQDLADKTAILKRMVKLDMTNMHDLGLLLSKYYINKKLLLADLEKMEKKMAAEKADLKKDFHSTKAMPVTKIKSFDQPKVKDEFLDKAPAEAIAVLEDNPIIGEPKGTKIKPFEDQPGVLIPEEDNFLKKIKEREMDLENKIEQAVVPIKNPFQGIEEGVKGFETLGEMEKSDAATPVKSPTTPVNKPIIPAESKKIPIKSAPIKKSVPPATKVPPPVIKVAQPITKVAVNEPAPPIKNITPPVTPLIKKIQKPVPKAEKKELKDAALSFTHTVDSDDPMERIDVLLGELDRINDKFKSL